MFFLGVINTVVVVNMLMSTLRFRLVASNVLRHTFEEKRQDL